MPPTTGHLQLLQFANELAPDGVVAVLCTQPFEPFPSERASSLRAAITRAGMKRRVNLIHFKKAMEQDPQAPGFWDTWKRMMESFGITNDDIIVASETYGRRVAEVTGTKFFPYDIARSLNPAKATSVRQEPLQTFESIIPEFQPYVRTRVTIFGAESTGKTTLSKQLASELGGQWLFEYARPYLENTVNEITPRSMTAIWNGQRALQRHADNLSDSPFIIQDTDLFSTVGYWRFPHWQNQIGSCPEGLVRDAQALKSDLYIITRSTIPFEPDSLRYGGDVREGSDEYWIDICERFELPYVVLASTGRDERFEEAKRLVLERAETKTSSLTFTRFS